MKQNSFSILAGTEFDFKINFQNYLLFCFLCICLFSNFAWAVESKVAVSTQSSDELLGKFNNTFVGISANPAAVNIFTGTGELQHDIEKSMGITDDHGVRIGGMLLGDANDLFSGGIEQPERWT